MSALWGVFTPGGEGLLLGDGGLLPGGCLLLGGVCSWGGVYSRGVVYQHTLRQTQPPLWTESQTPVKTLPWPNFVAAGNDDNYYDGIIKSPPEYRLLGE